MRSIQQQARYAGFLYLLMGVIAPFGLVYAPGKLIVAGDAAATAQHVKAGSALLRAAMASELIHQAIAVFLVLALYRLFKPVDEGKAQQLVALGALVSVPIVFLNVVNEAAALVLTSGASFLAVFSRAQLDALAYLFMRLHGQGLHVAQVFWGLWLFPFGMLVIRSRFIPRWIGVCLLIAGAANLSLAAAGLLLPDYAAAVFQVAFPLTVLELPVVIWLPIWGAKPAAAAAAGAPAA